MMTVKQLREELAAYEDHLPVVIWIELEPEMEDEAEISERVAAHSIEYGHDNGNRCLMVRM